MIARIVKKVKQIIEAISSKEPALLVGVVLAGAAAAAGVIHDGWQWNTDSWIVLTAILTALGVKFNPKSWSQDTVDELAPKSVQKQVLKDKKVIKAKPARAGREGRH